jgi:Raf kinase inhibitor-like YbhB/YbcL family protein
LKLRAAAAIALVALASSPSPALASQNGIVVTSSAFHPGGRIPLRYAAMPCGGQNISVPLRWRGVPPLARSLAVSVFDPDARSGAGFWHWIVYDVPSGTTGIAASIDGASFPRGSEVGRNDEGTKFYFGPCPPKGELHHYRFTVYALSTAYVQAKRDRGAALILERMTPSILRSGTLTGTFAR